MHTQPHELRAAEGRNNSRTNLYLAAVLQGVEFSAPVKVRNMSPTGALLEGAAVPPVGAPVRLIRGSLAVTGEVVWSVGRRCGLHFSSVVSVHQWMAPAENRQQQRVDDAVSLLKARVIPLRPLAAQTNGAELGSLESDLRNIAHLLQMLAERLVTNEVTVLAHGKELQSLDIAAQMVDVVASSLDNARDPDLKSRMENLRVSCQQALQRGRPHS